MYSLGWFGLHPMLFGLIWFGCWTYTHMDWAGFSLDYKLFPGLGRLVARTKTKTVTWEALILQEFYLMTLPCRETGFSLNQYPVSSTCMKGVHIIRRILTEEQPKMWPGWPKVTQLHTHSKTFTNRKIYSLRTLCDGGNMCLKHHISSEVTRHLLRVVN